MNYKIQEYYKGWITLDSFDHSKAAWNAFYQYAADFPLSKFRIVKG
jgi:hypothetical protein